MRSFDYMLPDGVRHPSQLRDRNSRSAAALSIATGEIGNDRPIKTINESWFSKELKVTVLFRTLDPRMGEMSTRLTEISLHEPDAQLFVIPPDYTVVEEQSSFSITFER